MVERWVHNRWFVLTTVTLVHLVGGGISWNYLVMVSTEIIRDFGLEVGDWGILWSGINLGVLAFALPAGSLGDRFGVRRIVGCGLLLNGAALLMRAEAAGFPALLASMIPFGMSLGIFTTNLPKALGMWFPPERLGLANGIALAGFGVGQGIAVFGTPRLLPLFSSWRELTVWLAGLIFLLAVYWSVIMRDAPAEPTPSVGILRSMKLVLRVRDVWLVALCYMLYFGAHLGVYGYLPVYLETVRRIDPKTAGLVLSLGNLGGIVGSLLLPALSDRIGRRKIVYAATTVVTGLMIFSIAHLLGAPLILASMVWGLCAGAVGLIFVVPVEIDGIGPALAGSAIGVIISAGFLGGVFAPSAGMSLGGVRPIAGFAFFASLYLLSAALFLAVRETGGRR